MVEVEVEVEAVNVVAVVMEEGGMTSIIGLDMPRPVAVESS